MKYLLDTNICIHWLRGKYSIAERIQERGLDNCCISEITKAELLLGEELALKKGYNVPQGAIKKLTSILEVVPIGPGLEMFAKEKAGLIAESLKLVSQISKVERANTVLNSFCQINGIVLK